MADKLKDAQLVAISLLTGSRQEVIAATRAIGQATSTEQIVVVLEDNGIGSSQARAAVNPTTVTETATDIKQQAQDPAGTVSSALELSGIVTGMADSAQGEDGSFSWSELFDISKEIEQVADWIYDPETDGSTRQGLTNAQEIMLGNASDEIQTVINQLLDGGVPISGDILREALNADNAQAALGVVAQAANAADLKKLNEAIDQPGSYLTNVLMTGDGSEGGIQYMSAEALREQGITAQLSERHDELIGAGWGVYISEESDGTLEVLYIDPDDDRRAIDIQGNDAGSYDPGTGDIIGFETLDTRAPIGMSTGTFIPDGDRINVVAGRADASLQDFYDLYGWNYTDVVNDMDFEAVLRNQVGIGQNLIDLFKRGIFPLMKEFEGADLEIDLHYQYLAGENVNMFIDMPNEDFAGYQQQFEQMGVYTAPGEQYGKFDPDLVRVINSTMAYANSNYEADPNGFDKSIADMLANTELASRWLGGSSGGGTARVWRPPAYLAPDYAELSQAVKLTFEQKLGRAPSGAEITLLSDKMKADHRGEFDAQVEGQRLQFFGSGAPDAGTVQDVNYAARFQEDFEGKYSDELGTLDRSAMQQGIMQNAFGSVLSADRAIGY